MAKDREQLKRELKSELMNSLSSAQNRRESLLKEKAGELERLDNEIEMLKLKLDVIEKLQ